MIDHALGWLISGRTDNHSFPSGKVDLGRPLPYQWLFVVKALIIEILAHLRCKAFQFFWMHVDFLLCFHINPLAVRIEVW
jgi:hypothetical protein